MTSALRQDQPLLEVTGLKKHFPFRKSLLSRETGYVRAVDGLDFSVAKGETLGVVGESGCGKSTMGQLLLRLIEPTAGEVRLGGRHLGQMTPEELRKSRCDIQIIFQDPYSSLNPRMKVKDLVAEPLKIHRLVPSEQIYGKVRELLELVGLGEHHMDRHPHEFSGGQRQRIGIARALAVNPKLIVCDEPVSALDVSIQAQILNLLKELQKRLDLTYIFIAHGLASVRFISDRIAVMYLGKIVELASSEELFASPKHPYTQALLSAVPIPDPARRRERIILQGDLPNPANPPAGCAFHTRCPYATLRCREEAPLLAEHGPQHFAACHFALESFNHKFV